MSLTGTDHKLRKASGRLDCQSRAIANVAEQYGTGNYTLQWLEAKVRELDLDSFEEAFIGPVIQHTYALVQEAKQAREDLRATYLHAKMTARPPEEDS